MLALGLGSMEQRHVGKWTTGWCKSFIRIRADDWRCVGCCHSYDHLDCLGLRLISPAISLQTERSKPRLAGRLRSSGGGRHRRWQSSRAAGSGCRGMLQAGEAESATSPTRRCAPDTGPTSISPGFHWRLFRISRPPMETRDGNTIGEPTCYRCGRRITLIRSLPSADESPPAALYKCISCQLVIRIPPSGSQ